MPEIEVERWPSNNVELQLDGQFFLLSSADAVKLAEELHAAATEQHAEKEGGRVG